MQNAFIVRWALVGGALAGLAFPTTARAQAPAPAGDSVIVVEKPTYATITLETTVGKPVVDVWKRVGKYCDVAEWLQIAAGCKMLSGVEGEVGSVRSVANEVLVGKTDLSYTYTQTVRAGRPYNLYHGTLEARPVTDKTSKIVYTLMYDNSMLPDAAAREKDRASRTATFERAMANMKTLAEGGKLAPR